MAANREDDSALDGINPQLAHVLEVLREVIAFEHGPKIDKDSIFPDRDPLRQGVHQPQNWSGKRQEPGPFQPKDDHGGCWQFGLTINRDPQSDRWQEAGRREAQANLKAIAGLGCNVEIANPTGTRKNLGEDVVQETLGDRNSKGTLCTAKISESSVELSTEESADPFIHGVLRAHLRRSGRRPCGQTNELTVS